MEKKLTITIEEITDRAALFCQYDWQSSPQPCYLELDCDTGVLTCGYRSEIGNGIPMGEYLGRLCRWPIPCLLADSANSLLEEVAPIAQRILDGYSVEWDGHNTAGEYTDAAQDAIYEISQICDDWAYDSPSTVQVWDASDWFAPIGLDQVAEEYGICSDTTDLQLSEIAVVIRAEEDVDELRHLETFLRDVRQYAEALEALEEVKNG